MQYSLSLDNESGAYIIKVTGVNKRPEDTIKLQQLARSLNQEEGITRFVFDMREADIHSSPADDYEAAVMQIDHDHTLHFLKFASVFSGELGTHKFMETVAINRGYQVRVFDNMQKAINWVTGKGE